jgi:hypothetical protein
MYAPSETMSGTVASVAFDDGLETATGRETTMKAIVQEKYGSSEVLELRDIDKPEIGDSDVLVRVQAAAVNPADWARGF